MVKDAVSNLTMPSLGWRLDDQQVADVVNFIRTSWGNNAPSGQRQRCGEGA